MIFLAAADRAEPVRVEVRAPWHRLFRISKYPFAVTEGLTYASIRVRTRCSRADFHVADSMSLDSPTFLACESPPSCRERAPKGQSARGFPAGRDIIANWFGP